MVHSWTLAWKIPWTEEPGRLQSLGSLRVGHDWATSLSLFTFMHRRRKWQPTPVFLPGESQWGGAWWAAVYGVAQSRTRLKRLSSSSSSTLEKAPVHGNLSPLRIAVKHLHKLINWVGVQEGKQKALQEAGTWKEKHWSCSMIPRLQALKPQLPKFWPYICTALAVC